MLMNRKRVMIGSTVLAAAAGLYLLLRPSPQDVEVAYAVMGPLQVTVDGEGETRVRDRYVVAAPVAGRVARIDLREGDAVAAGAVVARVYPAPLDARSRQQAEARVEAAADAERAAQAAVSQTRSALDQARRDRNRAVQLQSAGLLAPDERERAELVAVSREREMESADFRAQSAAHDIQAAQAALLAEAGHAIVLTAPSAGRVLRVPEQSERVVSAGTPLLELGDPARLEIVADLLSSDAVKVTAGAPVLLEGWGGDSVLRARVRTVEPSGFTKVSALGVDEQRVNVVADFVDSARRMGDRYRVELRIVVWAGPHVLKVPANALFRSGAGWALFVVEQGRASHREVSVGHRTSSEVEVLQGLREGELVLRNPGDRVAEGVRVRAAARSPAGGGP